MTRTVKRILAALLSVLTIASVLPVTALAAAPEKSIITYVARDAELPDGDTLFSAYVESLFKNGGIPVRPNTPPSLAQVLGPVKYAIEQRLKAEVEKVAFGETTETDFEVSTADLDTSELTYDDVWEIYHALLKDCTSSMYWHNVLTGVRAGIRSSSLYFSVSVDVKYQGQTEYSVNPDKIEAAKRAVANAGTVIERYASASDVDKLLGYTREICDLVEYDYPAAASGSDPAYGTDPWQLVHVFDGNPDTNVVCEGYSKAFEHLCDHTAFNSALINCYCVTGDNHMWNIVRMDDGRNYVVDVTWSDPIWGSNPDMFLSYALSGSVEEGYSLTLGSGSTLRHYDLDQNSNLYDCYTKEDLTISFLPYGDEHDTHTPEEAVRENMAEPTCTNPGGYDEVIYCRICGEELSRTHVTLEATGHTPMDPVCEHATEAVCTQGGSYEEVVYCAICGEELSRTLVEVEAIGHTPGEAVHENYLPASCEMDGSWEEVVYCQICGEELSRDSMHEDALGHEPGEPYCIYGVIPTCTETGFGVSVVSCVRCGTELSRTREEIAPLGHDPGEVKIENEYPATYESEGGYDSVVYCRRCSAELSREHHTIPILVVDPPVITEHPQPVTAAEGKRVSFRAAAEGEDLTYQWQIQNAGTTGWTDLEGETGPELTFTAAKGQNGCMYRCVVSNAGGETVSEGVKLTVVTKPKITTQPKAATVKAGKKVTFKVKASGGSLTYQWYYQKKGTTKWVKISKATKASYSFTAKKTKNGYKYRCLVKNAAGKVYSKAVKLTVK